MKAFFILLAIVFIADIAAAQPAANAQPITAIAYTSTGDITSSFDNKIFKEGKNLLKTTKGNRIYGIVENGKLVRLENMDPKGMVSVIDARIITSLPGGRCWQCVRSHKVREPIPNSLHQ